MFACRLEIKQASEGSHHVPGIVEAKVENISEVWDVLQTGSNSRAVGSNNVNEHSSRSHWLVIINIIIHIYFLKRFHFLLWCTCFWTICSNLHILFSACFASW
jgi:hypothetical protein